MNLHKIKISELDCAIKSIEKKIVISKLINTKVLCKINKEYSCIPLYFDFENPLVIKNFKFLNEMSNITIFIPYGSKIKDLTFLENFKNLKSLDITTLERQKISFKKIEHITSLETLNFNGIDNKGQYKFINLQTKLKKLSIRKINFELIEPNDKLEELNINSTIKSENQIHLKFPNLKKLNLHGCSRIKEHYFISKLDFIEDITINYNSHLTHFPKINNPKLLKRIVMLTCPNFCDIESILLFENLETLCLTSYDKPLKLPINKFKQLKALKKLKRVYTVFGRRKKEDLDIIAKVYEETKWINNML